MTPARISSSSLLRRGRRWSAMRERCARVPGFYLRLVLPCYTPKALLIVMHVADELGGGGGHLNNLDRGPSC